MLKPCLKWAGGKGQIIDKVISTFPKKINNYYEPFIGGGSVFLALLGEIENKNIIVDGSIILNDANRSLILLYNYIKNNIDMLIDKLTYYEKHYNDADVVKYKSRHIYDVKETLDENVKLGKSYVYYYYRSIYNNTDDDLIKASLFLVLNKTCFRGLYRESKNKYNVPFGNYANPTIFIKEHLRALSQMFNKYKIEFHCQDFKDFCKDVKCGDFVYLDPPYYPLNKTSFVAYKGEFDKHDLLVKLCNKLHKKKVKFVHSNSWCTFNIDNYAKFKQDKILCRRRINSKDPSDKDYEIIISN